jgi:heat-inducible transcriptional repressor
VVVLREGSIKQSLVALPGAEEQDTLTTVAAILNDIVHDATAARATAALVRLNPATPHAALVMRVGERLVHVLEDYDRAAVEEVFSDGLLNVLGAPEFAHSEKVRRVFNALENRAYLGELVGSVAGSGRIRIVIGAENSREEMHDVTLILAPYGRPGRAIGVVGVLGPTRMSYPNAIGTVAFVSGLMDELVDHLYA